MSKVRRRIQFSMSTLVLLMTVASVGLGVWLVWSSKVEVLVATEDLDHKRRITNTNVEFQRWPAEIVPPGAITAEDGIPVGEFIATSLRKGQVVIRDDVFARSVLPNVSLPPGYRVINIKTLNVSPFRPGDRVDVVISDSSDDSQRTICKGVRVFNIGSSTQGKLAKTGIVGLLVNEDQTKAVVEAKAVGELRLTLRGDGSYLD